MIFPENFTCIQVARETVNKRVGFLITRAIPEISGSRVLTLMKGTLHFLEGLNGVVSKSVSNRV